MEITKKDGDICEKCGARSAGEHSYCPNCGALLPGKAEKYIINKSNFDALKIKCIDQDKELASLIRNGYAPYGKKLIANKEYSELKTKSDRYDDITMYGTICACSIPIICVLVYLVWLGTKEVWSYFSKDTKARIEIVKDNSTGLYGLYDHGKDILVTPYEYDSIQHRNNDAGEYYKSNYYLLFRNGLRGVADSTGVLKIACEIESMEDINSGLIIMRKNGFEGLFDTSGNIIVSPDNWRVLWEKEPEYTWDIPGTYVGDIIPVKKSPNTGWELFNRKGNKITSKSYQEATQTGIPDLIKVKENGYYGLINSMGKEILKCEATRISRYSEGIAFLEIPNSKYVYAIDKDGNTWFSFSNDYKKMWHFSEGLFALMNKDGKIGYYYKTGKLAIQHLFEQAKEGNELVNPSFEGYSARISYHGKNGYVFKNGSIKLDAK